MICLLCQGDAERRETTYTHATDSQVVVIRGVPALVCTQCGDKYFEEEIVDVLLDLVDRALATGQDVVQLKFPAPVAA